MDLDSCHSYTAAVEDTILVGRLQPDPDRLNFS